jgi:serine/threonine protein kinase
MALSPGTILDNKYCIEAAIGRGGFGYVYRARERLTGEIVAIKELTPGMVGEPQVVRRFIQEARATLRLPTPTSRAPTVSSRTASTVCGMSPTSLIASCTRRRPPEPESVDE